MTNNRTLLVNKKKFEAVEFVDQTLSALEPGYIRVKIGPWALTANNVTYMVTGDRIGYWHYFAPESYGIKSENQGRMPVWGFGEVTESQCKGVSIGQMIYGFLPIAKSLDMKPVKMTSTSFQDGNDHRVSLHGVYNSYTFTDKDSSFSRHRQLQPILRPLFTTSFLIDDALADNSFYGAKQVLILSASSKTALGTAFCLKARGGMRVTGLTSQGNKEFVEATTFYDQVYDYGAISQMDKNVKTVIVDMSGNGKLLQSLVDHFGENLTYICRVGLSHWDAEQAKPKSGGPKAEFFFAPDRAKQRVSDWGGPGFAQRLGGRWMPFLDSAASWLSVKEAVGEAPVLETYQGVLSGSATPDQGYLFTL